MTKMLFKLFVVNLLVGVFGYIFVTNVNAQACGTLRVDRYSCYGPNDFTQACVFENAVPDNVVNCSMVGGSCQTAGGICSSNDTCTYHPPTPKYVSCSTTNYGLCDDIFERNECRTGNANTCQDGINPSSCGCSNSPAGCNNPGPTSTPTPVPTVPPTPPPGCGSCGGCSPACNSSCQGVCSGNGAACTINGGACGGNIPPNGYHDDTSGNQSAATCYAAGWVTDPDDRTQHLNVRVLSDGSPVASGTAGVYFPGLDSDCSDGACANVCPGSGGASGGYCGYIIGLNGVISGGVNHSITVQAQDWQTNLWQTLNNSPKTLNCACSAIANPTITAPSPANSNFACTQGPINIQWNAVGGATAYAVRIDERNTPGDGSTWVGNCGIPQADAKDVCLDNNGLNTSYTFTPTPGKYYVYWIHAINGCGSWSSNPAQNTIGLPVASVDVVPNPAPNLQTGTTQTFTANILPAGAAITNVQFDTSNGSIAALGAPNPDTTSPYQNTVTAGVVGSATIGATANLNGNAVCSDATPANVTVVANSVAWWQVRGGDVTAGTNIRSVIPATCIGACVANFNLSSTGLPNSPGVNTYTGSATFGSGTAGPVGKSWLVGSNSVLSKKFNYAYFSSQIPADVAAQTIVINTANPAVSVFNSGGTAVRGYYWYSYDGNALGDLNLQGFTLAGRKIVILVNGANVNINGRVTLSTDSSDFFMLVAGKRADGTRGNINISSFVASANALDNALEGLFLAEGQISTGVGPSRIVGKGSFVGFGGFNFQRNLADNSAIPAEYFVYGPEMVLNFPPVFTNKKVEWQEVAP